MSTSPRVLIVEDSPDDAELMILALRRGGSDPAWERVESADALAAALAAGPWDAVLCDYTLPGFGALAALAVVRAADPDLPFVVVSGTVGEEVAVEAMRAGANDYVLKRSLTRLGPAVEREVREAANRRAKRAAEGAAAHLAAVVTSSYDAIISKTLDGVITTWNPAAERMYGWAATEAVGRHISFIVPPDKADELEGIMARLQRGERVEPFETVRRHRDGRRVDVALTISPILAPDGRVVGASKVARDITDRKRAEAALRASEERFRALMEQAPVSIQVFAPDGRPVQMNRAWQRMWGTTLDQLAGYNVLSDQQLEANGVLPHLRRAFAGEVVEIPPHAYDTARAEPGGSRRADLRRWLSAVVYPLLDESGQVREVVAIQEDITDRKRAEDALRASEARLRRVIESDMIGTLFWRPTGEVTDANDAFLALVGYTRDDLRAGRVRWSDMTPPEYRPSDEAALAEVARAGRCAPYEKEYVRRDGSRIPVMIGAARINGEGVAFALDLTPRRRVEAALRESEARFRTLVENASDGLFVLDSEGVIVDVNRRACQSLGYGRDELVGRHVTDIDADVTPDVLRRLHDELADGRVAEFETRHRRKDGETFPVEVRSSPLEMGGRRLALALVRDVTDRRRAEEAVRRSEAELRTLVEAIPEIVWVAGPDGANMYVNARWREYTGDRPDDPLGSGWERIIHPGDLPGVVRRWADAARSGDPFESEHRIRRHDGAYRWFLVRATALRGADGRVVRWYGMCTDIDDRRRAEEAVRLRDRAIRAVTQGILITDPARPDNPIVYASPGFERLSGYAAAEVVGRNCRLLQGKDTDRDAVARLRAAIRAGESCTVELLNYRKDTTAFWNEVSVSPVRDETGTLTHFVGVQTDVTARKRLEEQWRHAQKMEAIGRLAGGVAHDFNNLLTIINGYSDLLLQSLPPGDPSGEMLAEIHRAGERSAGLTRQLLAFSRQQVLAPRVLDLNAVVGEAEKMLRRVIGEDVRLAFVPALRLWPVKADAGQVEQVLLNLAVNARDAMPTGGRLTIETGNVELGEDYAVSHPDTRPGPHVLLAVSDTGCGMTDEVKARIFEPFFTTKGPGKGTGLGLSMVYGFVKQSGGHIGVYSEVGIGTTFKVYLPRAETADGGSKSESAVRTPPRGTETVLLVEDESGVRALTRLVLAGCGYTVLEAADVDEAVRAADRHPGPIHLVVTDVVMPGVGGQQVAEQVAERHPGARVLFMSGYTDDAVVRHGVLSEGVSFLQKPFSPVALAHKVREVLDAPPPGRAREP